MCLFAKCYTRAFEQVSVEQVCIARHGFRERIPGVGVMVEETSSSQSMPTPRESPHQLSLSRVHVHCPSAMEQVVIHEHLALWLLKSLLLHAMEECQTDKSS